jgi:hypothetical protein
VLLEDAAGAVGRGLVGRLDRDEDAAGANGGLVTLGVVGGYAEAGERADQPAERAAGRGAADDIS